MCVVIDQIVENTHDIELRRIRTREESTGPRRRSRPAGDWLPRGTPRFRKKIRRHIDATNSVPTSAQLDRIPSRSASRIKKGSAWNHTAFDQPAPPGADRGRPAFARARDEPACRAAYRGAPKTRLSVPRTVRLQWRAHRRPLAHNARAPCRFRLEIIQDLAHRCHIVDDSDGCGHFGERSARASRSAGSRTSTRAGRPPEPFRLLQAEFEQRGERELRRRDTPFWWKRQVNKPRSQAHPQRASRARGLPIRVGRMVNPPREPHETALPDFAIR